MLSVSLLLGFPKTLAANSCELHLFKIWWTHSTTYLLFPLIPYLSQEKVFLYKSFWEVFFLENTPSCLRNSWSKPFLKCLWNTYIAVQPQQFDKLIKKQQKRCQNIWFNQQCLRHNIIPKYFCLKSNSTSAATSKLGEKAKILWVKKENESLCRKPSIIKQYLKVLNSELSYQLIEYSFYGLSKSNISNITYEDEKRLIIIKNLIPLTCLTCSLVFQQWNVF